jgi:Fic family protein
MLNFSYTVTSRIRQNLDIFEAKRASILTTPISPRNKLMLRWSTMRDRIYYSLALANSPLSKKEITTLLTKHPIGFENTKKISRRERQAIRYRQALEYIRQEWLVTDQKISTTTIVKLNKIATKGSLVVEESILKELADYLQTEDNIILKAAIAHNQLKSLKAFSQGNARTARLLTLLILYKHGQDVSGTINLDEYFYDNLATYLRIGEITKEQHNLTAWLEFATSAIVANVTQTEARVKSWTLTPGESQLEIHEIPTKFWKLTERQKHILSLLTQPLATITNRKVQRLFKVSQITASRDLAKLTNLGLLLSHGKGRSVYYTKV